MIIDEDMKYAMTNFSQVPKGGKAVDSDHMTLIAKLDRNVVPHKEPKEVLYNLKNVECQNQFKMHNSSTTEFTSNFKNKSFCQQNVKNGNKF